MTEHDFNRIESALDIQLPQPYRRFMSNFPIPALVGNSQLELWDDADALIRENLALRDNNGHAPQPWPARIFCLGHSGGGWVHALDLDTHEGEVWYVEHYDLTSPESGAVSKDFADWASQYLADVHRDLQVDGIDPDGTPDEREAIEEHNAHRGRLLALLVIVVVTASCIAGAIFFGG